MVQIADGACHQLCLACRHGHEEDGQKNRCNGNCIANPRESDANYIVVVIFCLVRCVNRIFCCLFHQMFHRMLKLHNIQCLLDGVLRRLLNLALNANGFNGLHLERVQPVEAWGQYSCLAWGEDEVAIIVQL